MPARFGPWCGAFFVTWIVGFPTPYGVPHNTMYLDPDTAQTVIQAKIACGLLPSE